MLAAGHVPRIWSSQIDDSYWMGNDQDGYEVGHPLEHRGDPSRIWRSWSSHRARRGSPVGITQEVVKGGVIQEEWMLF